jgi:hypothetical protein
VRRDASYLNWKYVDQPGQEFVRLEITATSGARGIVVMMFRGARGTYKYRGRSSWTSSRRSRTPASWPTF